MSLLNVRKSGALFSAAVVALAVLGVSVVVAAQMLQSPQKPQVAQVPQSPQVSQVPQVPQVPQVAQTPQVLHTPHVAHSRPPVGPPLTDEAIDAKIRVADLPAAPSQISFVLNGFRRGQLDPCGCPSKQLGGFDKEAKVTARIKADGRPLVLADAGGIIREFSSEPDIHRSGFVYRALRKQGYVVGNVGFPDILVGESRLKTLAKDAEFPLISANLTDTSGTLLFPPYHIEQVDVAGRKVAVGFIGTTRQRMQGSPALEGAFGQAAGPNSPLGNIRIQDPAEQLRKFLPELKQKAEVVVLLHFGRRDQLPDMLQGLGDVKSTVDLAVAGEWGGIVPLQATSELPAVIATGYEGRQVTRAILDLGTGGAPRKAGAVSVEITQDIPPVEDVTKFISEAKAAVAKVMPTPFPGVPAVPRPPQPVTNQNL